MHIYNSLQGPQGAWFNAWTPESDMERAVILEDDMELSPLWFRWLKRSWDLYGNLSDLGGISLCRQRIRASDGASVIFEHVGPHLYRMPSSCGFSPNAKFWGPFVQWMRGVDWKKVNIHVAGTITSSMPELKENSWEQHWIWFSNAENRQLYTLYVHSRKGALVTDWAEEGITKNYFFGLGGKPSKSDELLSKSESQIEHFPSHLDRYDWNYDLVERNGHPTDPTCATTNVIWSNDFHISPIANVKQIVDTAVFIDKSLSGACQQTHTCQKNLMVLNRSNGIAPNESTRKRFQAAYRDDKELASANIVMCFHPSAMCELFMPLKKRLFVIASTRYEMGRHDKEDWTHWNEHLKIIAADSKNVIAANNVYDLEYIKYFTGIVPILLESVSDLPERYKGISSDIIVAELHSPHKQAVEGVIKSISPRFRMMKEKYGTYTFDELCNNTAILHIPYQTSVMSLFEQYAMGIPILVPTPAFLWELHNQYTVVSERTWEYVFYGERPKSSVIAGSPEAEREAIPDPNNDLDKGAWMHWIQFADFYMWPHIVTFNSWTDLNDKIEQQNWKGISNLMLQHNAKKVVELKEKWRTLLDRQGCSSVKE